MEDLGEVYEEASLNMEAAIEHLSHELTKIRAGRASRAMLEGISVEYYGSMTPLEQVSNISAPDARTLTVQPYEKSIMQDIERAITNANLGLNPQDNGEMVIISVPTLTEERRKSLVKQAKAEGENAKVSIRNARKEANDQIKKLKSEGMPEDVAKTGETRVQQMTDEFSTKVDKFVAAKETDIMTV